MSALKMRSTATSISVTRSMVPFLSMRMTWPKRAIWSSPALTTASMAVVRNSGSDGKAGIGGRRLRLNGIVGRGVRPDALGHADLHAAFRGALEPHIVH